jgi:DNA recombination-dependent growth factor C
MSIKGFIDYGINVVNLDQMVESINNASFKEMTEQEDYSIGFIKTHAGQQDHALQHGGKVFLFLRIDRKNIDESKFKRKLSDWKERYVAEHNLDTKEPPEALVTQKHDELLAEFKKYAPEKTSLVTAIVDTKGGRLFVCTPTPGLADEFVGFMHRIRKNVEDFKITKPRVSLDLGLMFTGWLARSEAPSTVVLGDNAVISYPEKGKVTIKNRALGCEEVVTVLTNGRCTEIGLGGRIKEDDPQTFVSFAWTEKGFVKSINAVEAFGVLLSSDASDMDTATRNIQTLCVEHEIVSKLVHRLEATIELCGGKRDVVY